MSRRARTGATRCVAVDDRGSVTAETAVVLPVVVLVLAVVLAAGTLARAQVSCLDAARAGARAAARGDGAAEVSAAARAVLVRPGDVRQVPGSGGLLRVDVTTQVPVPGSRLLPASLTRLTCSAHAWPEERP